MHPEGLAQVRGQKLQPFWSYRGAKMWTFHVRKWAIWRLRLGVAIIASVLSKCSLDSVFCILYTRAARARPVTTRTRTCMDGYPGPGTDRALVPDMVARALFLQSLATFASSGLTITPARRIDRYAI